MAQKNRLKNGSKKWCSGRDSNPHGLLHTPLKRARLPITPPEQELSRNYLFAGGSVFVGVSVFVGAELLAAGSEFVFVSPGIVLSVFEFVSSAGAVFELASAATAAVGSSGLLERTETLPFNAGIARKRAENINAAAAAIVTFDKTVAVPRGLNAVLETLLVNNAPASVLPGCNKTAATSTMHERKNIPYKI